nr:stage II sporulation protein M [Candidatus Dormibacteraeota bacterium]
EVLLSTPLREAEIYAGKVASVLGISLVLCFGALFVYCGVTFPGLGYFPLGILVSLGVSTICQVAAMVAGAVIVSANARTMRAANVMASFIILPMSVVLQVEAALILVGRGELLWGFAAAMAVGAAILLRMGLGGFSREALLARETGSGDRLRRFARAVSTAYREAPGGLRLVRARLAPILTSLAAFPVGAGLGFLAASVLPHQFVRPVLGTLLASGTNSDPAALALAIFLHNLLAIVLAGLFAAVTLGFTGYLLTGLPGALVGYAAALSSWGLALTAILPNALIEIPVAAIAGGLAIQVGAAVIHLEPDGGWTRRVLGAEAELAKALLWLTPLLAVAAVLEAYLSPRP